MDLSTNMMGLDLANPLVVGASPLSDHLDICKQLEDAGAAAIVMHSLFMEQVARDQLGALYDIAGVADTHAEALSFFPEPDDYALGPEAYLDQVRALKASLDIPVIASLNGITTGAWTRYAGLLEQAGADGIELNVYHLPLDGRESPAQVEARYINVLRAVKCTVSIPVGVKLISFLSSPVYLARQLVTEGADGLVLFNRLFTGDIDIEELEVHSHLELSPPGMLKMRLMWLAAMHGQVDVALSCSGGVHSATDVIKSLMAGASSVQLTSALLKYGPSHLAKVRTELQTWLEEHEYPDLQTMVGSMSLGRCPDPEAFERGNYLRTLQSWHPPKW